MDNKLAKELKDAGFPQEDREYYYGAGYAHNKGIIYDKHHKSEKMELRTWLTFVACPTLSELIEACGQCELLVRKDYSTAGNDYSPNSYKRIETEGKTPEEAVAKLWLKLKK